MSKNKNEVAPQQTGAVSLPDYGQYAGQGTDDFSQQERGVPFLKILQAQSPEVMGPKGQIEGARAGMFLNTGTEELHDTITIVPVCRIHAIQEWRPRNQGGGLVKQTVMQKGDDYPNFYKEAMKQAEDEGRDFGDFWTGEPNKSNQLSECYQLFAVALDEDQNPTGMIVVPFSSTAIGAYRKRISRRIGQLRGNPPMFAFPLVLSTEQQTNDKGSWYNYVIDFPVENNPLKSALDPQSAAFQAGAELFELVKGGHVAADQQGAERARGMGEAAEGDSSAF